MYTRCYTKLKNRYRCYTYLYLSAILVYIVLVKCLTPTAEVTIKLQKRTLLQVTLQQPYHDHNFDQEHRTDNDDGKLMTVTARPLTTKRTIFLVTNATLNSTTKQSTNKTTPTTTLHKEPVKSDCELPAISEFPGDLFTQQQRRQGGLIFHLIITLYMFLALAIVCDYYFVSSLEVIVYKLQLQADVAGASLMAIGSSAPELFASLIGVFITKGDIGIGTILGSAVFNVLFVLGLCGILASKDLCLSWWPVTRDSLCYAFTLLILTVVIFDGSVTWRESAFMLMIYMAYLTLMWYNERIEKWFYEYIDDKASFKARFDKHDIEDETKAMPTEEDSISNDNFVADRSTMTQFDDTNSTDVDAEAYPDEGPKELLDIPESDLGKVAWFFSLPVYTVFFITIPDIRRRQCRSYNTLTFVMSIVWIGFLTYILIWMVTIIGFTFSIPDSVMGLTFIAFGSSVPDALASILVARQGKGDMAVSQALGSNVFDILFGLGLPWLIKTLIFDLDSTIEVQSIGMLMSCSIIFCLVLALLAALYYKQFILSRKLGIALLITYTLFLIISVLMEIYVWSGYELPQCHIEL